MTINIQIDAEHLEQLAYIGQQTDRDPNALLSQAIDYHFDLIEPNSIAT